MIGKGSALGACPPHDREAAAVAFVDECSPRKRVECCDMSALLTMRCRSGYGLHIVEVRDVWAQAADAVDGQRVR